MGYVFISHSHVDRPFVNFLVRELAEWGVEVWYDAQELEPGTEWRATVTSALQRADAVIIIIGYRSDWVIHESAFAYSKDIPVILIALNGAKVPESLTSFQGLDFSTDDPRQGLSKLKGFLLKVVQSNQPVKPKESRSKGYVFISYAEENSNFVLKLREYLERKGYGFWDYQSSDRDYQTLLFLELESAITNAAATLSVLSPDWKKSKWTAKELIFSEEVGTPVFLLLAFDMGPTLVTAGMPYIDFTVSMDEGFARLDKELQRKGLI